MQLQTSKKKNFSAQTNQRTIMDVDKKEKASKKRSRDELEKEDGAAIDGAPPAKKAKLDHEKESTPPLLVCIVYNNYFPGT